MKSIASSSLAALVALVVISFGAREAGAHARLRPDSDVTPRSTSDGIKTNPPCGGLARSTNVPIFTPGQTITLKWEETVQHPGRFEFYLSTAGEQNLTLVKTIPDDQNGTADLPHQYSTTITLPNTTCEECTLQFIQQMTENPALTAPYYSCGDFKIRSSGTTPPSPTATPRPSATPLPNCD